MELHFDQLVIDNFAMIRNNVVVTFPYQKPGLYFVRGVNKYRPRLGANEVGKSTIFGALTWCLYGRTVENWRNTDIKPWRTSGTTRVDNHIRLDNRTHTITRTANPNKLLFDGNAISQDDLDRKLGINYKIFTQTILLGQGQPLFFDLEPRKKMELFAEVLQLDRWEARSKFASTVTADLERKEPTLTAQIEAGRQTLKRLDHLLADNQKLTEEWERNRAEGEREVVEQIGKDKERLERLQNILAKAELMYDAALTELRALNRQAEDSRVLSRSRLSDLEQAEASIRSLQQERSNIGDTCSMCGQSLKGTALQKHKETITRRILTIKQQLKNLEAAAEEAGELNKRLQQSRDEFQRKADTAGSELRIQKPEVVKLEAQIAACEQALKKSRDESNPYRAQAKTLRQEIERGEAALETDLGELKKLQARIQRTRVWIKGFKEVQLDLIEEALEELEIVTNATLPDVGLDDDWRIKYGIEKETLAGTVQRGLNVSILSPDNRSPVRWESWSGGVQQRLRLVGSLALSEVLLARAGVTPDLEILDEPSRALSVQGIAELVDFLSDRAGNLGRRTLLVDHHAIESDAFAGILTVTRAKSGVSASWGG